MSQRVLVSITSLSAVAIAFMLTTLAIGQTPSAPVNKPAPVVAKAAPAPKKAWTQPRLPDGHPDFTGYWSNSTVTPLERPAALADKDTVSEEEAKALELNGNRNDERDNARRAAAANAGVGDYNGQVWYELGKKVLSNKRTSIVTDPADGRIPALIPAAAARVEADRAYFAAHAGDGPEGQDTITRCITWITSGPPMLPTFYNNDYQFVQTKDSLAMVAEMIHDARIIHLDGKPHADPAVRQWMGDSRGHWEGDTLVVETTNFNGKRNFLGGRVITEGPVEAATPGRGGAGGGGGGGAGGRSGAGRTDEKMKVIERFTRTAEDTLLYQFMVDDPGTYVRPWSGEIPMHTTEGPIYEYACHEGNYAMVDILSGARADEKAAQKAGQR